jgi:hypothetical protein
MEVDFLTQTFPSQSIGLWFCLDLSAPSWFGFVVKLQREARASTKEEEEEEGMEKR